MKKPYTCLILGVVGNNHLDLYKSFNCYEIITSNINAAFDKLTHVDKYVLNIYSNFYHKPYNFSGLRKTDFIIYVDWDNTQILPFDLIREKTQCRKMVSFLCIPVPKMDHNFCFIPHGINENCTVIPAPCNKDFYKNVLKKKMIIIDHYQGSMQGNRWDDEQDEHDWTIRISDWLADIKDEYFIRRMIRFGTKEILTVKQHEDIIPRKCFGEFIDATNEAQTFIVTHAEGYGYGIIDMVSRGIRVVSPPGFISPDIVNRFNIPIFRNKEELLKLVTSPVEDRWNHEINKCTGYDEIANIIDNKFQEYLQ